MSERFKTGDRVSWSSPQGTVHGKVVKKLTEPIEVKSHQVAASAETPQYLVESEKTGAQAAHKPESLEHCG